MPSTELAPLPFDQMRALAESIAKSGMFGIRTADQAMVLMALAQSEGRHPVAAARDYHIISGSPAKKSEAMLRDFLTAGGRVQWHELSDSGAEATFTHPQGGEAKIRWDTARVQQAGLMGNAMHKKYPRQMLRSRVVSEGVRTVWPMATGGLYAPEEAADMPRREPIDVTPSAAPVDTAADLDAFAADAVVVDEDALRLTAETAAMKGTEMFRAFWGPLSAPERDLLRPDLSRYQAVAATADATRLVDEERARDEDPLGLPPLPAQPEAEVPAVPFAAAVRALVPVAGDDGELDWRAWSEAFVALVQQASRQDCEKLRISSLPQYNTCRTFYSDGARAIVEALAVKAKAAEPAA